VLRQHAAAVCLTACPSHLGGFVQTFPAVDNRCCLVRTGNETLTESFASQVVQMQVASERDAERRVLDDLRRVNQADTSGPVSMSNALHQQSKQLGFFDFDRDAIAPLIRNPTPVAIDSYPPSGHRLEKSCTLSSSFRNPASFIRFPRASLHFLLFSFLADDL
jgi:hypothetical protein